MPDEASHTLKNINKELLKVDDGSDSIVDERLTSKRGSAANEDQAYTYVK